MAAHRLVLVALIGAVACKGGGGGDATPDAAGGGDDASTTLVPDAAVDGAVGPVTCADSTLLFCEDFESLPPGPAISAAWTTDTSLWFGWRQYQGGTTPAEFDLWLDDLAVSSARIGC